VRPLVQRKALQKQIVDQERQGSPLRSLRTQHLKKSQRHSFLRKGDPKMNSLEGKTKDCVLILICMFNACFYTWARWAMARCASTSDLEMNTLKRKTKDCVLIPICLFDACFYTWARWAMARCASTSGGQPRVQADPLQRRRTCWRHGGVPKRASSGMTPS
jgi:hypothetical protein